MLVVRCGGPFLFSSVMITNTKYATQYNPVNTKHLYNSCTPWAQRHRRRIDIVQYKCYINVLCLGMGHQISMILLNNIYITTLSVL